MHSAHTHTHTHAQCTHTHMHSAHTHTHTYTHTGADVQDSQVSQGLQKSGWDVDKQVVA